jgi:hypothetical protein
MDLLDWSDVDPIIDRVGRFLKDNDWSQLPPLALIARLAALVPAPRRHTVLYCGVLSSHASSRKKVVPNPPAKAGQGKPRGAPALRQKSLYGLDKRLCFPIPVMMLYA